MEWKIHGQPMRVVTCRKGKSGQLISGFETREWMANCTTKNSRSNSKCEGLARGFIVDNLVH